MGELSGFAFAVCQLGAERALKADVLRDRPAWRAAFQRPGLLTFRVDGPVDADTVVPGVLVRHSGASLGPAEDVDAVVALARPRGGLVHVFERDRFRPGDAPPGVVPGALASDVAERLRAAWPGVRVQETPREGDVIIDVVVAEGEPFLVGCHRHAPGRPPWPGGRAVVDVPPEAPSRAYGKLEEALAWSGAPVRAGDVAVELGSAPGGATYALLRRGVTVHGVDPGEMSDVVKAFTGPGGARLVHHHARMSAVARADLPEALHWIVVDVNAAPQVVLGTVARLCGAPRGELLGVLATLKLDDWKAAAHVPGHLDRLRRAGFTDVRATQLAGNRMEVFACGLTEKGVARRGGAPKHGFPRNGPRATARRR